MRKNKALSVISAALVIALSMSACNNTPPPDGGTEETSVSSGTASVTLASSAAPAETQENIAETDAPAEQDTGIAIIHPRISSTARYYTRSEDYKTIVTASFQTIELTDEEKAEYPRLAKALNSFFSEVSRSSETSYYDMKSDVYAVLAQGEEDDDWEVPEYMLMHNDEDEMYITRADSVAFTFRKNNYCYFGGTHPYSSEVMCNFDTATGHELYVEDVVKDLEKLNEILYSRLTDEYDGYIDDPAAHLEQCRTGEHGYNWLLCHDGVLFHFNTYTLGPYASGYQTVYIGFDEYPDLFEEKYTAAPDDYAIPLKGEAGVYADIDGDGKADCIRADGFFNDDNMEWTQYISCSETETSLTIEACNSADSYLVRSGGRYYIYNFCNKFDGYALYVFDVTETGINDDMVAKQVLPCGLPRYSMYYSREYEEAEYYPTEFGEVCASFTDPADVFLSEIMFSEILTAHKKYSAGTDGMLASADGYYTVDEPERSRYVSLSAFTADILDKSGNVSEKEAVFSADTAMSAIRSDGKTYMDFRLDDGREIRIYITLDGYDIKINGKDYFNIIEYLAA